MSRGQSMTFSAFALTVACMPHNAVNHSDSKARPSPLILPCKSTLSLTTTPSDSSPELYAGLSRRSLSRALTARRDRRSLTPRNPTEPPSPMATRGSVHDDVVDLQQP